MKRALNINIFTIGFFLLLFSGCIEDSKIEPGVRGANKPAFEEGSTRFRNKTISTIEVSAKISTANGAAIEKRGFCYNTESEPTIENDTVCDSNVGIGEYILTIKGLSDSTTYYIRPFAINSVDINYGDQLEVTTYSGRASVITLDTINTYASKATVKGYINKTGEGNPGHCGFYYSTNENFDQKDSVETRVPEIGSDYSCELPELTPDTEYYYLAYVKNDYGLSTGDTASFKTKDGKPYISAVKAITEYTHTTLSSTAGNGGDITVTIIERGFCIREHTADPSENSIISSGDGVGYFEKLVDGLKPEGRYIVKAYATSNWGLTEYSKDTLISTKQDKPTVVTEKVEDRNVFGGNADVTGFISDKGKDDVFETGICWSASVENPDHSNSKVELSSSVNSEGKFFIRLTGLKGGVTYYVQAFAKNGQGLSYGGVQKFTTPSIFNDNLEKIPVTTPLIRNSAAYFSIDGVFYLLGGDIGPEFTTDLWSYTVSENKWKQLKSFGEAAKWQTGVGYGTGAYVFGGVYEDPDAEIGLHYYISQTNEWRRANNVPDTLYLATGCTYSNSVIFIGGKRDTVKQSVWNYQHALNSWEKMPDFPEKQYGGFAVVYDRKIYAGMGKNDAEVCNGSLWVSEDGANTWNLATQCTIYHGGILAGVVSSANRRIYVIDEDYHILEYSPELDEWKEKSKLPSIFWNHIHCMYEYSGKIYIGLGGGEGNTLMVYDPLWDN